MDKKSKRTDLTGVILEVNLPIIQSEKVTWKQAMEDSLFWKKAQGVSEATLKGHSNHIRQFFKKFEDVWGSEQKTKQSMLAHMAEEIKPATYNLRLIYLRAFFNWCQSEGIVTDNPLTGYKKRKADPRIVEIPIDTLKKLLSLPNQKTFAGLRDYVLSFLGVFYKLNAIIYFTISCCVNKGMLLN